MKDQDTQTRVKKIIDWIHHALLMLSNCWTPKDVYTTIIFYDHDRKRWIKQDLMFAFVFGTPLGKDISWAGGNPEYLAASLGWICSEEATSYKKGKEHLRSVMELHKCRGAYDPASLKLLYYYGILSIPELIYHHILSLDMKQQALPWDEKYILDREIDANLDALRFLNSVLAEECNGKLEYVRKNKEDT